MVLTCKTKFATSVRKPEKHREYPPCPWPQGHRHRILENSVFGTDDAASKSARGKACSVGLPWLVARQIGRNLIFQLHALATRLLLGLIGDRFDAGFHPMHGAIDFVISIEHLGEMGIVHLELVDLVLVLGKFIGQFMRSMTHRSGNLFQ